MGQLDRFFSERITNDTLKNSKIRRALSWVPGNQKIFFEKAFHGVPIPGGINSDLLPIARKNQASNQPVWIIASSYQNYFRKDSLCNFAFRGQSPDPLENAVLKGSLLPAIDESDVRSILVKTSFAKNDSEIPGYVRVIVRNSLLPQELQLKLTLDLKEKTSLLIESHGITYVEAVKDSSIWKKIEPKISLMVLDMSAKLNLGIAMARDMAGEKSGQHLETAASAFMEISGMLKQNIELAKTVDLGGFSAESAHLIVFQMSSAISKAVEKLKKL